MTASSQDVSIEPGLEVAVAERVGRGLPFEGSATLARVRRLPAALWFVILVVVALLVAVLVAIVGHTNHPLDAEVRNFSVTGPTVLSVTYQVTKSPLSTSSCQVQAVDEDHDIVGTTVDVIGPTDHNLRTTVRTVAVKTTATAVSAQLGTCSLLHTS